MTKYTQKQLREMVQHGIATDLTSARQEDRETLIEKESYLEQVGYCAGLYGCSGKLLKGYNTGALYAIIGHVSAIYLF